MLLKLAAFAAIGYAGMRYFSNRERTAHPAFAEGQPSGHHTDVRDAGPAAMRDSSQQNWSATDQASDESFPASDPPGNY
jgi:hypothetical protein